MKRSLAALLFSLVLFGLAMCVYGYGYFLISRKSVAVASLEQQILSKMETASRVSSAHAALAEISGDEATVQTYFVSQTQVVSFIDALQTTGTNLGTKVEVLSVSQKPSTARSALAITLSVSGSFDAVMRTVGAIEFSPYDLTMDTFGLSKDVSIDLWQANMTITVGSAVTKISSPTLKP